MKKRVILFVSLLFSLLSAHAVQIDGILDADNEILPIDRDVELVLYAQNGTTTGSGTYTYNDNIEIQAIPDDGYAFSYWSDFSTDNPRTVQLTQAVTTLTAICLPIDEAVYDLCLADADELSVYFIKPDYWNSDIHCYMWHYGTSNELTDSWHGNPATAFTDRLYKFMIPAEWGEPADDWMIIWNDGVYNQTEDHRYQNNAVFSIVDDVMYGHGNITTVNYVCTKVCPDAVVDVYDTICEGKTYGINSVQYNESGNYTFDKTYISSHGGDSIVHYHLNVHYCEPTKYTITFLNYNGDTLQSSQVIENTLPEYEGLTPQKTATDKWEYTFKEWSPMLSLALQDTAYTAVYDSIIRQYTVTFSNYDGTILLSEQVEYGKIPEYNGDTPQKPATSQWLYYFTGWQPQLTLTTSPAQYAATFDSIYTEEWDAIQAIYDYLILHDWNNPWDLSGGYATMKNLHGLTITDSHISGLNLSNSGITGSFPTVVLGLPYLTNLNLANNNLIGHVESGVNDTVSNIENINIAHNDFSGNIGAFGSLFPNLLSLDASYNHIAALSPVLSDILTNVDISHQSIQDVRTLDLTQKVDSAAFAALLPQIVSYSVANRAYAPVQIIMNHAESLWQTSFYADDDYMTWNPYFSRNIYRLQQGDTITATDNTGSSFPVKLLFRIGDADMNTEVDVIDLQALINYICGLWSTYRVFNFIAADLYADDNITIQDMILMIDTLLANGEPTTQPPSEIRHHINNETETDATLVWQNGELHLMSSRPVAALDITIQTETDIEWLPLQGQTVKTKTDNNLTHTVIYSLAGTVWQEKNDIIIAHLKNNTIDNPVIIKAVLSDPEARKISVKTYRADISTDINTLTADCINCTTTVYDMQGKIVAANLYNTNKLPSGIYMLRTTDIYGKTVDIQKIIIR